LLAFFQSFSAFFILHSVRHVVGTGARQKTEGNFQLENSEEKNCSDQQS